MKARSSGYFSTDLTREQAKDSGMAAVLILLLVGLFTKDGLFFTMAAAALLMDMVFPKFYYPFAIFWFGLSGLLGSIVSKVLLSIIYVVIVLPVALSRKLLGKDPLKLKMFKRSRESVMRLRNHAYEASDIERPF